MKNGHPTNNEATRLNLTRIDASINVAPEICESILVPFDLSAEFILDSAGNIIANLQNKRRAS